MALKPLQDLGIKLVTLVVPFITDFAKEEVEYLVRYEKKVEELGEVVENLRVQRKKVDDKVAEEQERYGREIYDDVIVWLGQVDTILSEYDKFKEEEDREHARCCLRYPLSSTTRCGFCKRVKEIRKKVEQLLLEKHEHISRWKGAPSMGVAFSNADYQSFVSRTEVMDKIKKALQDPRTRMIGVHGLAGVGKTTLVIEAARNAQKEKLFNVVIMANVTKSPDIRKIQGQIADMLGMKLEEESEHARAVRIQEKLKGEDSTLIILDDLWAKVDLHMLGIPSMIRDVGIGSEKSLILNEGKSAASVALNTMETEETLGSDAIKIEKTSADLPSSKLKEKTEERYKYKVLLISEVRQVLVKQMDGKESSIFPVNILSGKDAETLFKKTAGIGDKNSELGKLAAQIAKRCNGLPMSIVTTARALKNQSHSVWEDTHRKLERQNLTGTPEYSTKLSYQLLENEELKTTFLLCARMGYDALVMDLMKHCIGLGFLQGIYTVREARDRVQTLLAKLKQSGLLSDSYSSDRFTMQNLVRSAALSIASEESHVFTLIEGKLEEWPDEDKLQRYTAISLRHCDVIEKFPKSINCPILRVFQVDNNDPHLKIPKNFFRQMKELRVLILTGIHLSPLPSSIRCLTKLRMLCLEQCTLGEKLCIIGKLKNLRILSFSGSDIESLPVELKQLTKLQIFDISNCSKLRVIPPNVISSLTSLEELYMRNTLVQWRVDEGQKSQNENSGLSELGNLNQLTNLDIQIPSFAHLPQSLFFDNLCNYKIIIGSSNRYLERNFKMPEKYELSRFLAIQQKDDFDIHSQKGIKMLFERVEILLLEKLNGVQDIFYALNLKGFPCLQHLSVVSNSDIRALINPKERKHPEDAFPKLESLHLYKLKNMEQICSSSCQLSESSFGKLKTIKIELCGQLKNVFFISTVILLTALETIQVSECNSLKEIVPEETQGNANEVELKFPELRSLTLQSLPMFIGFYPISSAGETNILFHKKVVVSKLERMELSSIQINQIWIDQCSHFQNLIHLDVNGCWKLEYLLSFSMAKNLVKLQSLFVSECVKMERIFSQGQDTDAKMKLDSIFPNLKNIKLSNMKNLSEIWSSKVPLDSFGKLDTLIIEKCDKFVNVFPRYMEKIFQSLGSLKVTTCKSMNAIFDLADQKLGARVVTNLQDVHLETLPQLEHVLKWKKDQEGILELTNLQKLWVQDCHWLENIFPVSVAKTLKNLEYLMVWDCFYMREIVAKGDANNNPNSSISFEFPRLTTIKFLKLPKFISFYPGAYELSCPELNDLSVELCEALDPFREDTPDTQRKPVLFPEKVINKLKSMQIESWHVESSTNYDYRRDNLEDLCLSKLNDTNILYSFLHHNPSLKSLWLNNCSFEELVPLKRPPTIESLGVVPKLKNLKLTKLPNLKNICFERDTILQRIEFLSLKNCPSLDTIALSAISLGHLTNLELTDCKGLKYLMHPSTAKSLGKLRNMKVINCESLEEIVLEQRSEEVAATREVEEGGGEGQNAGKVDIIFRQLKALELVSLKNLKSFCSSKSCVFEFPSLEKVVVSACPKMENFSQNFPQEVKSTQILQKVYVVQENEKRWCWEGNLQATIQYMFKNKKYFEGMAILDVSEHPDLQQVWQGKGDLQQDLGKDFSYSLNTLKLDKCKFESYAIRPNVLRCLKRLKELEVRNCDNIIGIFEMDDTKHWGTSFSMKKLTLEKLPDVTHVWGHDKQGIPSFHNLQQVTVTDCKKLKTLFPAALARNLKMLEKLEVERCVELLEIVGKEGEAAEGTEEKFVFPLLTKLALRVLPKLTHFYSERFTLECPELNLLRVTSCNNFELFQSQQEVCPESQGIRQPLFSDIKSISKVEQLILSWKGISSLGQPPDQGLQHLHQLMLFGSRSSTLPIEILDKTPNLKRMDMYDSESLKKLFPSPNPQNGNEVLGNLQTLFLVRLSKLQSMEGLEYLSLWLLHVEGCPGLTTLAQSCSNVKYLRIRECDGLECLFTYSAAKMSIHLVDMDIWGCKSMKEIVGKEHDDEIETEEIKFEWLERIQLQSLSKLECFYSGNSTLHLPSLIRVDMVKCPKMKFFSQGLIHTESSRGVLFSYAPNDDLVFYQDLNTAVGQWILHERHLVLADYPEVEGLWTGRVPIPSGMSFNKLRTLKVEGCEFLSNVVLPSHLLSLLRNLEELVVRKCNSVEAIFDVKNTPTPDDSYIIVIPLKKLTLQQLPTLRHVWNEDPKGRLSFPLLKEVFVKECKSIKSLFPTSVAKDNLQKLDVINCAELVEIVAKDEGAKEEAIVEVTMFPSLTWLQLWSLPTLRCICSGMQILNWPMLRNLVVSYCGNLKIFTTNFQNFPVSHPKGQDRFTTDNQGFVSARKVVAPYLEQLSLNKEDVVMIEQERLHVDLQKIKTLALHSFNDESTAFPHVFFLEMPLPSIQRLQINDSAFEEIFPSQRPDLDYYEILSKLKILELHLPKLKSIGLERTWMAPLLENLEYLKVWGCTCLTNLAPSTVSLSHLTRLQVDHCVGLEYLFTSSTARSFVVLREMSISNCESLEKVVAEEGDQPNEDVIFTELTTLSLSQLQKLESFYKGNSTLNFPCLKDVSFSQCKSMKTFSHGNVAAPGISMVEINGIRCYGTGLNTAFSDDSNTSLVLGEYPELNEPWLGKVPIPDNWSFSKLRSLVVEECQFLSNAIIPSHILCFLSNFEELVVRKCNSVKAIFEVNDTPTHDDDSDMIVIPLKKLTLQQLPTLRHVWNEDPKGRLSFPLLKEVFVKECKSIKSLFPTSVAKDNLQKLDVINCAELVEIVAKDEGAKEEAIVEVTMFPSLTWLQLWSLPNLRCICSGMQILNWPLLRNLVVSYCRNLKIFATDFQNSADSHSEGQDRFTTDNQQGFVSAGKVFAPYLEQLSLNKEDAIVIEQRRLHVDLQKIKTLTLHSFNDESDTFPHVFFLEMPLPSIQRLQINDSAFEEIFPSQRPDLDYYEILSKLKILQLHLPKLKSIGLERTWMAPLLENLEYLKVWGCTCLTNLAPSTVSLSHLTTLHVENCVGLEYLFTSSAAKSLVVLHQMSISNCESLEKVVAEEGDQPNEDVIFTELTTLSLSQLPKLESFYKGNSTLNFPCLKDVSFTQCKSMKTFSHGNVAAPRISMVEINGIRCYGTGLNTAFSDDSNTSLVLGEYPELNEPWLGKVPIPDNWSFSKLRSLVVEECQFLSNAIIPSHILCFLSNFEELVVRKCNSVKAIFEVNDTPTHDDDSDMIVIPLKKLTLQQLPTLRHVWNEDPKGRLSFPLLKEVFVKECKSIKSLFPTSVAKDNLQKLDVINCAELVEIVAKDEGAKEEAIVEVTMFPSLTWLQLWSLPNLRCICSGMQILNWPLLRNLVVSYCRNLKIFATDFQNSADSHSEGQDRFTTDNQQGFVSAGKVFAPYLEQLSLNKEDAIVIEQRRLHVDLQKIKTLTLHSFNDESDTFPHVFFLEMPLPSIQRLEVRNCAFEEIFPSQRPDLDYYEILSKLKILQLHLPKLKSIGLERTWMAPLLENLEYLKVWGCTCLTNLAPSTVSLSHLTTLHVAHCVGLEYLFTSTTAKSLVVLREVSITKCESLEKVVAEDGEQPDEDVIFTELTTLSLSQLPKLESFYTGSSTMDFPCLKDISLTECKSMKTFSHGNVVAPSVCVVKVDGICCSGDLNAAVCQQIDKGSSPKLA